MFQWSICLFFIFIMIFQNGLQSAAEETTLLQKSSNIPGNSKDSNTEIKERTDNNTDVGKESTDTTNAQSKKGNDVNNDSSTTEGSVSKSISKGLNHKTQARRSVEDTLDKFTQDGDVAEATSRHVMKQDPDALVNKAGTIGDLDMKGFLPFMQVPDNGFQLTNKLSLPMQNAQHNLHNAWDKTYEGFNGIGNGVFKGAMGAYQLLRDGTVAFVTSDQKQT